jgi:tRNA U34 5-methylaminomethyl-2-thiouridine-forming methyltransferase MnmC
MKADIIQTGDSSDTIYLEQLDEHYHSTFGAIRESMHVFIQSGFRQCRPTELKILEIGFGTGLNCYLTLLECLKSGKTARYYSLEKYPLEREVWEKLNYPAVAEPVHSEWYQLIHSSPWDIETEIHPRFRLCKLEADATGWDFKSLPGIDLVYYDAFSPAKQPELWEKGIFENLFHAMKNGSIFVTYCARGSVRRNLQSVGFRVERIPGPPGKREMLRAFKPEE